MNLVQLRSFVAVVEHGSFSAAARMLGVSQPAVTMQVQALESDVGATLLDRKYRGVELTEAGKTLLPHARAVIDELEEARDQLGNLGASRRDASLSPRAPRPDSTCYRTCSASS